MKRMLVLVPVIAAAACGTTVPTAQQQSAFESGLGAPAAAGASAQPGVQSPSLAGASAGPDGVVGTAPSTTRSASGPSGIGPTLGGKPGVVVGAKKPVLLGLPYVDQEKGSTVTGSIGAGLATGDVKGMTAALVSEVNAQGGILGHPVKIVPYEINVASSQNDYEQAACTSFTQDNKVLVVLGAAFGPNYLRCVTKGGAAVVGADWSNLTQAAHAELQYLFQPAAIALDRLARIQAEQFVAMGLFESTVPVKVGVLYFDPPEFVAAEKVLEQELAKRGITVATRQAFNYVGGQDDIAQTQSQVQSAILKFRSEGITHVIGVETNAWLIGFFGVGASGQGYYPRYGYTSDEVLSNVAANVPARALEGARFVGWTPAQDITDTAQYPPEAKTCLDFMRKKGFALETGNQRNDALNVCESLRFVVAALTAGGEPLSRDSLRTGARSLGSSYSPTATFRSLTTPRNYDGVAAVRQGAWKTDCSCFAYTSGLLPIL